MSAVEKRMFCTEMTCYVNKSIDFFFCSIDIQPFGINNLMLAFYYDMAKPIRELQFHTFVLLFLTSIFILI